MALRRNAVLLIVLLGLGSCSFIGRLNPFTPAVDEPEPAKLKEQAVSSEITGDRTSAVDSSTGQTLPTAEEQAAAAGSAPARLTAGTSSSPAASSVEILWQVPGESIEKYHLEYGSDPANLDRHLEIPVAELEKVDHPVHGPLFRYVLTGVAPGTKVFFTVQAENQYGLSPKSAVQEIK